MTGQPDFAKLEVTYQPGKHLIETKSFKLFLWSYRDKKQFNERLVDEICQSIYEQAQPIYVKVRGLFAQRGGISVEAIAERTNPNYLGNALLPMLGGLNPVVGSGG